MRKNIILLAGTVLQQNYKFLKKKKKKKSQKGWKMTDEDKIY